MTDTPREREAFHKGAKARRDGEPMRSNPYLHVTLRQAWFEGYQSQDVETKETERETKRAN